MREKLPTPFSPVTWIYGAYAGFPLFLQYFPLPFIFMAILSLTVSLLVAFKLVTLLAIIPLPCAIFYCLRRLGYTGWTPALGAVLSLTFLFMTDNSMWGGNICSTLAGEFSFGISFILYIIYIGKLYSDLPERRSLFGNSLIEAFIALSSGYPLLQAGMGTSYFILRGRYFRYTLILHAAAFGLAGFWLVPLLWRVPWDTPFVHCWSFKSWTEAAPPILWPPIAGACICIAASLRTFIRTSRANAPPTSPEQGHNPAVTARISLGNPEHYLWWQFLVALLGFSLAPSLGLVDIRFLPFAQISIVLLGAIGWGRILGRLPRPGLWATVFCAGIIALAMTGATQVDSWIQWNYSGFESKPLWNSYQLINQYLAGDQNSPRVVYEHTDITNGAGTVRAFEMLPYYSGRSTLEGLYMQSSPNSPFVFYIQSELSEDPSCPFSAFYYSRPDPERAAAHLRLFNVSQVITATENISNALDASPNYELQSVFPPYRIYNLTNARDSYVEPVLFQPFRISKSGLEGPPVRMVPQVFPSGSAGPGR